jgi:hypothetical protein
MKDDAGKCGVQQARIKRRQFLLMAGFVTAKICQMNNLNLAD